MGTAEDVVDENIPKVGAEDVFPNEGVEPPKEAEEVPKLAGFAADELPNAGGGPDLLPKEADWVDVWLPKAGAWADRLP